MIKDMAWNFFKNTGNINTYLEFSEFKKIEKDMEKENLDGVIKSKGNSNIRK